MRRLAGIARLARAPKPVEIPYAGSSPSARASTMSRVLAISARASSVSRTGRRSRATATTSARESAWRPIARVVMMALHRGVRVVARAAAPWRLVSQTDDINSARRRSGAPRASPPCAATGPVPATGVARALNLPRSTTYHLLAVLREHGFVTHLPEQRRYGPESPPSRSAAPASGTTRWSTSPVRCCRPRAPCSASPCTWACCTGVERCTCSRSSRRTIRCSLLTSASGCPPS